MANPFIPTFGVSPMVFAGRASVVSSFGRGLDGGVGDPRRVLLLSGPRGIGKTVTLNELEDEAKRRGWVVLRAHPNAVVHPLVDTVIPQTLATLRERPTVKRRITGIRASGWGIETEVDTSRKPSASLISSLNELSRELGPDSGILITVDEVQSADPEQLWELTAAIQDLMRDNHNVAFAAAGLPEGIGALLQHPGTTFLRRAQHANLGPMTPQEAADVLVQTAEEGGVRFNQGALDEAVQLTRGYPYLVQLVGFHLFERAAAGGSVVESNDTGAVTPDVLETLGQLVHEPALRGVPPKQHEFLVAMAQVQHGNEAVSVSDIADELGGTLQSQSMARKALLDRELIYSPRRGFLNFTIPHMGYHLGNAGIKDTGWD